MSKTKFNTIRDSLGFDNGPIATKLLAQAEELTSDDIHEIYSTNRARNTVDTIELDVESSHYNQLNLSELLIGNNLSVPEVYEGVIEQVKTLPDEMKPHVINISGIVQGDFKFLDKNRRPTLADGLKGMGQQFKQAKRMFEKAIELDVPVIYNLSNDDHRIAEDYTVEVFRNMQSMAAREDKIRKRIDKDLAKTQPSKRKANIKKGEKTTAQVDFNISAEDIALAIAKDLAELHVDNKAKNKGGIGVDAINSIKSHPAWEKHYNFQIDTILPLCFRAGRRLYTAEEMAVQTEGKIAYEEYFLLFDAFERKAVGKKLTPQQKKWMKRVAKECIDDEKLIIKDGYNIHTKTADGEYTDWVRHHFSFSDKPMYQDHMSTPNKILGQRAANGQDTPDLFLTQHNQESVGSSDQGAWTISTGGLIQAADYIKLRGKHAHAPGDTSKRLNTTRRRVPEPGSIMVGRTDDHRTIITFFNNHLYEKSFSEPNRLSLVISSDDQIGSPTAALDYLIKYYDYIRSRIMSENEIVLYKGGDGKHGRNYANFPNESQSTGLMSMAAQERLQNTMMRGAFGDMSREELKGLRKVKVAPGNHEWNSGTLKWHGYPFTNNEREVFGRIFARAGYSDEEIAQKVTTGEALITPNGAFVPGFTDVDYFGDFGVLFEHYLLERGGKGSGGNLPVYQLQALAEGLGELINSIDIASMGHFHFPEFAQLGNKISLVNGSMARISDYELKRAYNSNIAGMVVHIGGGLPLKVEFISAGTLQDYKIQKGNYTNEKLAEENYFDQDGYDSRRNGIYLPDRFAKSALQQKLLQQGRDASQCDDSLSIIRDSAKRRIKAPIAA